MMYAALMRTYDALMRTTVDLPDDLHRAARSLAHDRGQSLSQTISELVQRALIPNRAMSASASTRTPDCR